MCQNKYKANQVCVDLKDVNHLMKICVHLKDKFIWSTNCILV